MPESHKQELDVDYGFSAGNYANAYEAQDLEVALTIREESIARRNEAYKQAFILGFFSSYELHEIPATYRDLYDDAYHSKTGQRILELGYMDSRHPDYVKEAQDL